MKDKIKYLIHKLFIYKDVNIKDPKVVSCLINLLSKTYPDFKKDDIIKILSNIYEIYPNNISNNNITLTGYKPNIINTNDYNELYLGLYEMKKSLI